MALNAKQIIPQLLIGYEVHQDKYGIGKIVDCDNNWVKIKFPIKTTRFSTETLEDGIITLVDEEKYITSLKIGMVSVKLKQRNIKYFVHFTPLNNLKSIITKGLMPISKLEENHCEYMHNDELRLDQRYDAISLSVSFPNSKMFFSSRKRHPDLKWVVLLLDAEEIVKFDPAYFPYNAASTVFAGYAWSQFQGIFSFETMFDEMRDSRIPDSYTTNVQAEVMVNNDIPPKMIKKIVFCNEEDAAYFCQKNPWIKDKVIVDRLYFGPRVDCRGGLYNGK